MIVQKTAGWHTNPFSNYKPSVHPMQQESKQFSWGTPWANLLLASLSHHHPHLNKLQFERFHNVHSISTNHVCTNLHNDCPLREASRMTGPRARKCACLCPSKNICSFHQTKFAHHLSARSSCGCLFEFTKSSIT